MRRSGGGPSGGTAPGGGGPPPTRVSWRATTVGSSPAGQPSAGGGVVGSGTGRLPLTKDSSAMQRLLVTGGCGYLGQELVRRAPARGWKVRATWFSRPPGGDAEWVQADVRDAGAMARAAMDVQAVVHTAYRQGEGEWETNADGSAAVAAAAGDARLVHLSTDLVFDGTRGRYREDDAIGPVGAYGRSKAEAERRVAELHP